MRRRDALRGFVRTALMAMLSLAPAAAFAADGWLGVSTQALDREMREAFDVTGDGLLVNSVVDGSPADRAGVRRHDVIRMFDGRSVRTPDELRRMVRESGDGRVVTLRIIRDGRGRDLEVRLGDLDDSRMGWTPAPPRAPAAPRAPRWSEGDDDRKQRSHVEIWKNGKRVTPEHGDHDMPDDVVERLKDLRFNLDDFDGRGFSFMPGGPGRAWMMAPGRGQLGVRIEDLNDDLAAAMGINATRGVFVLEVLADSPAKSAGLRAGDVIVRVDGRDTDSGEDLRRTLRGKGEGSVEIDVLRKGEKRSFTVQLRDEEQPGAIWNDRDGDGQRRMIRLAPRAQERGERGDIRREMDELREELRRLREQLREDRR